MSHIRRIDPIESGREISEMEVEGNPELRAKLQELEHELEVRLR
jgi:hypothetical protein